MKFSPLMTVTALVILASKPLQFIYNKLFPTGYEDELGFHYGREQEPNEIRQHWTE